MYDPILADLRSHTLDYLKQRVIESGASHRCMFEFDGSMVPREGDKQVSVPQHISSQQF